MDVSQFVEQTQQGEDVGVEVIGIPYSKFKQQGKTSRPSSPSPPPPPPPQKHQPNTEKKNKHQQQKPQPNTEEKKTTARVSFSSQDLIHLPEPQRRRRQPKKHKAGEVLSPPPSPAAATKVPTVSPTTAVSLQCTDDPTEPVTYIEGDPAPPCFRVVGVGQQKRYNKKYPSFMMAAGGGCISPYGCSSGGTVASSANSITQDWKDQSRLTDEMSINDEDDDDESERGFRSTRQAFLQLDIEGMAGQEEDRQPKQAAAVESKPQQQQQPDVAAFNKMRMQVHKTPKRQREIFHDEATPSLLDLDPDHSSCGGDDDSSYNPPPAATTKAKALTDSSRCSGYSRKDYLKLTQELMKERKRELKQMQKQKGKPTNRRFGTYTKWAVGMVLLVCIGLALVITMVVLNVTDKQSTSVSAAQFDDNTAGKPLAITDLPTDTQQRMSNQNSPQFKAFEWLQSDPMVRTYPQWRQLQRMALVTLYFSTRGKDWKHASRWLSYDHSECQWSPQACDDNDQLRRLLLPDSNLDGTLPPELFWLTSVQQVQLHDNPNLRGEIPMEIGQWSQLQVLWMQRCGFSSQQAPALNSELGLLTDLLYLDLSENPLGQANKTTTDQSDVDDWNYQDDGAVVSSARDFVYSTSTQQDLPSELGQLTKLQELILHQAQLVGTIPSDFGRLTALQFSLQLQSNALSGSLPAEIGQWQQLEQLDLSRNHLSSSLPTHLGNLKQLQILDLSVNHLEGALPMHIGLCDSLRELWVYDNLLTGAVPEQLSMLKETLHNLDLSMNQFRSTIPPQLGELTHLSGMWMYQNSLSGKIPSELGNLHARLVQLSLFGNSLSGSIPPELSLLSQLRGLWLDENRLTGLIPLDLLESTSLIALHLYDNRLEGRLSNSISDQSVLQELRLESNLLSGSIPTVLSYLNELKVLNLHNNRLWGQIPSELSELSSLETLTLHDNEFGGQVPRGVCANKNASPDFVALSVDCNRVDCSCECQCPSN